MFAASTCHMLVGKIPTRDSLSLLVLFHSLALGTYATGNSTLGIVRSSFPVANRTVEPDLRVRMRGLTHQVRMEPHIGPHRT